MILYENSVDNFLKSASERKIISFFADEYYEHFSRKIESNIKNQWKYCMQVLKELLVDLGVAEEAGIRIDYVIATNYRWFEVILAGKSEGLNRVHVLQLLPFEELKKKQSEDIYVFGVDEELVDFIHPSLQVIGYKEYLKENLASVSFESVEMSASVYFYESGDAELLKILSEESEFVNEAPIVICGNEHILNKKMSWLLKATEGKSVLQILHKKDQLCSAGMDSYFEKMFEGNSVKNNRLFAEQKYIAMSVSRSVCEKEEKFFILNGMAGTGKSTIAITILKELSEQGYKVIYLTGSRAMANLVSENFKKYSEYAFDIDTMQSFVNSNKNDVYDLIILDEAQNTGAFFINEYLTKITRAPGNILFICSMIQCISERDGDFLERIESISKEWNRKIKKMDLNVNVRFSGQSSGINWLIHQLQIAETGNYEDWDIDAYTIKVLDVPDDIIKTISEETSKGKLCRAIVRYDSIDSISRKYGSPCIRFDEYGFRMSVITSQSRNAVNWYKDNELSDYAIGVNLVQGTEMHYACVIIDDLSYDKESGEIVLKESVLEDTIKRLTMRYGVKDLDENLQKYIKIVKNSYYVALSRGREGAYIYCSDKALQDYLQEKVLYASRRYSWIKNFTSNYDVDSEKGIVKKQYEKKKVNFDEDQYSYVTYVYEKFTSLLDSIQNQIQDVLDENSFKKICDQCSTILLELQNDVIGDTSIVNVYTKTIVDNMGESAWNKLSELSKKCLLSAEIIFHDLKDYNQIMDFSGVCVQVSKAVEYELANRFLTKYVEYLRNRFKNRLMEKIPKTLIDDYGNVKGEEAYTLGDVRFTVGMDSEGNIKNRYVFGLFKDYAKERMFINSNNIEKELAEQIRIVHKIKEDYRNKAAHKSSIDAIAAKDCINYVVEIERKLGMMLDSYKY